MERDTFSADDILAEHQRMAPLGIGTLNSRMYSADVDDGYGDDYLEAYLYIQHNCGVKGSKHKKKIVELGAYPVKKYSQFVKNLGAIQLK
ncbi:unnamed protein product [Strongylus vulgaris]|uniref:Uncharacterized protein n=1 Tax=Strongylus vulgaris TaxID=40348 RepID=A0A3P7ILQ0_STRVU|nr:unnamed protein product [Strongylus vulgaris]